MLAADPRVLLEADQVLATNQNQCWPLTWGAGRCLGVVLAQMKPARWLERSRKDRATPSEQVFRRVHPPQLIPRPAKVLMIFPLSRVCLFLILQDQEGADTGTRASHLGRRSRQSFFSCALSRTFLQCFCLPLSHVSAPRHSNVPFKTSHCWTCLHGDPRHRSCASSFSPYLEDPAARA
ncbi:hypothetical protein BV22DRAFT_886388 [Leucogyrophana mollusca]|uniref:Uncharacterized protein n=1 Tax=Leucogyrophana mollusca TaxID=85980 RepID=A0ACB8AZH8_9AGAM|nr:hypothetical protein BV22DRAFT_886388 [Leucogyrophana mollusca]